ncbi:hypothetical protein A2706_02015 [Candidatus Peribacteria bacterium RIFCSPHIGHO2_01_FULL_51_35]|nr:MAG: hypothetical protein A2706_02015 [Candidatus Peribacteria bacterium RIFCSPHIGHO2_01_FULL_51_35]
MIEFQRKIMGDRLRNDAFAKALKRVIRKDTTLTDIGSGTGFLSFIASKLGAKQCYLYEHSDALEMSKKIAKENGIHNCTFIRKHSSEVKDPVKTDVVISETLGNFALEEHIIENMMDAKRFLKPSGSLIPQKLRQFVCPVIDERLWKEINVWPGVGHGLKFSEAERITLNNMYVKEIKPSELMPNGTKQWDVLDFTKKESSIRSADVRWTCDQSQEVFGFALFFECDLMAGITFSTHPEEPLTHWEQIYLPLLKPIHVNPKEGLLLHLTSDTRHRIGVRVTWKATHANASDKELSVQSLDSEIGRT